MAAASSPRAVYNNSCPWGLDTVHSPRDSLLQTPRTTKKHITDNAYEGAAGSRSPRIALMAERLHFGHYPRQLQLALRDQVSCLSVVQQDSCFFVHPMPDRTSWEDVESPPKVRGPDLVQCPVCLRQVLSSSYSQHLLRCSEMERRAAASRAAKGADDTVAVANAQHRRSSWAEVPSPKNHPGPSTMMCRICKAEILKNSFRLHEKRCWQKRRHLPEKRPGSAIGRSTRRALWSDVESPRQSPGPATVFCHICERDVLARSFQHHQLRCSVIQSHQSVDTLLETPRSRRTLWRDVATPAIGTGPPTLSCPTCRKQVLAGSYEKHVAKCERLASSREYGAMVPAVPSPRSVETVSRLRSPDTVPGETVSRFRGQATVPAGLSPRSEKTMSRFRSQPSFSFSSLGRDSAILATSSARTSTYSFKGA